MLQHREAPGVCKYNFFIYLVDCRVLLGYCWWPKFASWFASAILVCFHKIFLQCVLGLSGCDVYSIIYHFVLQALYLLSCFWCDLCIYLCCCCMSYWICSLLLPSMYSWNLMFHDRSGTFLMLPWVHCSGFFSTCTKHARICVQLSFYYYLLLCISQFKWHYMRQ